MSSILIIFPRNIFTMFFCFVSFCVLNRIYSEHFFSCIYCSFYCFWFSIYSVILLFFPSFLSELGQPAWCLLPWPWISSLHSWIFSLSSFVKERLFHLTFFEITENHLLDSLFPEIIHILMYVFHLLFAYVSLLFWKMRATYDLGAEWKKGARGTNIQETDSLFSFFFFAPWLTFWYVYFKTDTYIIFPYKMKWQYTYYFFNLFSSCHIP